MLADDAVERTYDTRALGIIMRDKAKRELEKVSGYPMTFVAALRTKDLSQELRRVRSILNISVEPLKIAYYKDYNTNEVIRAAR